MLRVGLTGGIACGKSLVAGFLRAAGVPVVDDDDASRDAVAPGTEGLAAVVAEFGRDILLGDGSLDRARLGRLVFADAGARQRLMSLTFPFIGRLVLERLAAAERDRPPIVVYESALLIENGRADDWRPLVVVYAPPQIQLARLCARNGLTADEARDRLRAQLHVDRKVELADHVIDNSGTPDEARLRCAALLVELRELARTTRG